MRIFLSLLAATAALVPGVTNAVGYDSEPSPAITNFTVVATQKSIRFPLYPGAEAYTFLSATNGAGPFAVDTNFFIAPFTNVLAVGTNSVTNISYEWRATNNSGNARFYRVEITPVTASNLLSAQVLNRLTYGPTPDELDRIKSIGPQAYIDEQLAPWSLTENAEVAEANIATQGAKLAALNEPITEAHALLPEFRAWHVMRGVNANRQTLEILLQFWENHFVTEYGKNYNWLNNNYTNILRRRLAAQMEYAENQQWRAALLNPQCTFYDLLKISAESPAMIIYLDTVSSRGDGTRIPNENYARELLELFCFGVDNGYDQNDITEMSKAWAGWRVRLVHPTNAFDIFAPESRTTLDGSPTNIIVTNLYGVYRFNYQSNFHKNGLKTIFPGRTVSPRFGSPWAGVNYELTLNNGNSNSTNTVADGYQVIQHLANQPFTAEYLSVKLCRLLVHDGFPNPTTSTNLPEYSFYDYTQPNLSPEAQLVHDCMMAWETNSPKGQIWKVVETITSSDLFRSHAALSQKIKNPLEFTASAIRALRTTTDGSGTSGSFTAYTDGLAISGLNLNNTDVASAPLQRMGSMLLFDREAPDGYPEDGPPWISAGTLAERIRWVQSYCIAYGQSGHNNANSDAGDSKCSPVQLLQTKLAPGNWTSAVAVADYFVNTLYPGEGSANLQLYRDAAVNFLNTADNGTVSLFSSLSVSSTANSTYDNRVRGMVGMLMCMQRFHEQ